MSSIDTDESNPSVYTVNPNMLELTAAASVATVSFIASLVIVLMVTRKKDGKRLSTPYRRIIFGISISDMIQSFAFMSGPFSVPSWTANSFGLGNNGTCTTNGFLLSASTTAVPLETALLGFYYLCKLKFRLTNEVFARRFEWFCHFFIFLFVVTQASVAIGLDTIHVNTNNSFCFYAYQPRGCRTAPEIVGECFPEQQRNAANMITLQYGIEPVVCIILNLCLQAVLYCHAISWNRVISNEILDSQHREEPSTGEGQDSKRDVLTDEKDFEPAGSRGEERVERIEDEETLAHQPQPQSEVLHSSAQDEANKEIKVPLDQKLKSSKDSFADDHDSSSSLKSKQSKSLSLTAQDRVRNLSQLYTVETKAQATLYALAYLFTYFPLTLSFTINRLTGNPSPIYLRVFTYFYPLGGLFNMLVYTRPHVSSLRRNYKGRGRMSRFRAFFLVLKAGGEVPDVNASSASEPISDANTDSIPNSQNQAEHSYLATNAPFGLESIRKSQPTSESKPSRDSQPNSIGAVDGCSQSLGKDDAAYNSIGKWVNANDLSTGKGSQMDDTSESGKDLSEKQTISNISSGMSYSQADISGAKFSSQNLSTGNWGSNPSSLEDGISDLRDSSYGDEKRSGASSTSSGIWGAAFRRARKLNPSFSEESFH